MRVLIGAEAQGFGLSSTAVNLSTLLKGHQIEFIGRGLSYQYFIKEGHKAHEFDDFKDLEKIIRILNKYELFISINESKLAIIAKKIGLRVIYLDLLYWLWPLELNDKIKEHAENIKKMAFGKLSGEFRSKGSKLYDADFISHRGFFSIVAGLISDETLIQDFPSLSEKKKELFRNSNVRFVRPFVKKYNLESVSCRSKKANILVSLGGIPLQNNYAEVFSKALQKMRKTNVFKVASSLLHIGHKAYRHCELMEEISRADIILTPPGFITIFEIFSLKKPIFYLPPKNAGQYSMFNIFKDYGLADFIIDWEDIYPEVKSLKSPWDLMRVVEENMLTDSKLPHILAERIDNSLKDIIDKPEVCSRLIEKQSEFLKAISKESEKLDDCFKDILRGCS